MSTSLRQKLDRILAGSTLLALMLAGLLLLAFTQLRAVRGLRDSVSTQADIMALATAPALAFADPHDAKLNLSALRANPQVEIAAVYDEQGRLFASFQPDAATPPPARPPTEDAAHVGWWDVTVSRAIKVQGERVGALYLRVRHGLVRAAVDFLFALALVIAASLTAALLLSRRLHQQVTEPLRAIIGVARQVLAGRMQRLRRPPRADAETDALVDAFNAMLDELERRARTLAQANEALRTSEERYQLVVRGSSAGLWDWDLRRDRVFYAPRFKALLGYTDASFPDRHGVAQELTHEDDRGPVRQAFREALKGGAPMQIECRMQHRDGGWRWMLLTGMAERDERGQVFRMAGSIVDVTERKQAEQVLQEANRAKDQFLATLAHELRNPLAPIRSGLDILQRDRSNGPASQRARQTMERQLTHMIRLIDDLLDISRINQGKIHLATTPLRLATVIDAAVELTRPAIEAAGHQLTLDLPQGDVSLEGDATRLAQALGNLLNNAAKYTAPGGRILLRVWQEADQAVIEVCDNGVGIPPAMLDKVFSPFLQLEPRLDRAQSGLGIGLYLVRELVELHGGSVCARSEGPGQGSCFEMRLPCRAQAPVAQAQPSAAATPSEEEVAGNAGRKVLVVDDNVDAAETLVTVLDMMGWQARAVHDGHGALRAAADFEPDVVLLDIGLPDLDGYQVARRLRADAALAPLSLVALTGWGAEDDRRRAREAGFDHHLTKPVDVGALECLLAGLAPGG